jgi:hypothetical protein
VSARGIRELRTIGIIFAAFPTGYRSRLVDRLQAARDPAAPRPEVACPLVRRIHRDSLLERRNGIIHRAVATLAHTEVDEHGGNQAWPPIYFGRPLNPSASIWIL